MEYNIWTTRAVSDYLVTWTQIQLTGGTTAGRERLAGNKAGRGQAQDQDGCEPDQIATDDTGHHHLPPVRGLP